VSAKQEYRRIPQVVLALLFLVFGVCLAGLAFLRLGTGPSSYTLGRILKLILGVLCCWAGWTALQTRPKDVLAHPLDSLKREPRQLVRRIRWLFLPDVPQNSHSLYTRLVLTAVMLFGVGLLVISFIPPPPGFESGFWHRSQELRVEGLVLAGLAAILRSSARGARFEHYWPTGWELLLLTGLAALVTGTDIYLSQRIGMLASPPVYDGVGYMLDAKRALLQIASGTQHPIHSASVMMGNRYPVWLALLAISFRLFGVGEWQAYAVRFWPTLVILAGTFWVVRRRVGLGASWAAALFAALLPTLSLNLRSAAAGHQLYPGGYLTDLRPDLLFAAFLMLAVVLTVEHAQTFDERTAILAGSAAALAVLTKSSAMAAVFLACGLAGAYVLFIDWGNVGRNLRTSLWVLLTFAILLTPWLMAGGFDLTTVYIREVLTVELPLYSNENPTIRSELTYYYPLLLDHMGWQTVVLVLASPFMLILSFRKTMTCGLREALVYFLIAAALYGLVSASLAKNYFLGLPSYLVLWIFCWLAISTFITCWPRWTSRIGGSLLVVAIVTVALTGVLGARGLNSWQGHEFEEGRQDRAVMRQIALDLREVLSNDQTFVPMTAYGNPATLIFYMPAQQGKVPNGFVFDGTFTGPIPDFVRQNLETAKAVLLYANGNEAASFKGYAPAVTLPYLRAVAAWVQTPGSAYHLRKTYQFYRAPGSDQSAVELYVRDDSP
jgi:hypothetical protein